MAKIRETTSDPMDPMEVRDRDSKAYMAGPRKLFVHALSAAVLSCSCAMMHTAAYGQKTGATIEVNGKSALGPAGKLNTNSATGSNVAAAAVFNAGVSAASSYKVNSKDASNSEAAALSKLAAAAAANGKLINKNILVRNPALQAMQTTIINGTAEDSGGKGNFSLVAKVNIGESKTGSLAPMAGGNTIGSAMATANQTTANNGTQVQFSDSTTSSGDIKGAVGVAFTAHHHRISVDWTSPGSRTLTLDLSQASFTLQTQGVNTSAVGFLGITASYIDNTANVALPESLSSPLFSLTLPVISFDGGSA